MSTETVQPDRIQPVFAPNLCIEKRAYVVDLNKVGWWVDPDQQTITRAKDTK